MTRVYAIVGPMQESELRLRHSPLHYLLSHRVIGEDFEDNDFRNII
jgi:hypothetical protein